MKRSLIIPMIFLLAVSIVAMGFILAENSTTSTANINNSINTTNNTSNHENSTSENSDSINTTSPTINHTEKERETANNGDEQEREVKMTHVFSEEVVCRINFNIGILNMFISNFPNSSAQLQPILTNLQNDLSQIQSISNSTNVQGFVRGHFSDEMKDAISHLPTREIRNISLDQRAVLVSSYNQLKSTFDKCEETGYTNISQERLNSYEVKISNFQDKANKLAEKGFDISSLSQLLQDAQNQIIIPLGNATNASQIQAAVRTYCLFDGCINGTNFHLDAKFELTRLNIVLADLQKNAAAFNLDSATLSQAQQYLSNSQSILDTVGTSIYQQGQGQQIFEGIKNASKLIIKLMTQALNEPIGMPLK